MNLQCTVLPLSFKLVRGRQSLPSAYAYCLVNVISASSTWCSRHQRDFASSWCPRHQHDVCVINVMSASLTWGPRHQRYVCVINVMSASSTWGPPHQHEVRLINMMSASSKWCLRHQHEVRLINMRSASSTWWPPHQHDVRGVINYAGPLLSHSAQIPLFVIFCPRNHWLRGNRVRAVSDYTDTVFHFQRQIFRGYLHEIKKISQTDFNFS